MQDSMLGFEVLLTRRELEYTTLCEDELTKFAGAFHDIIAKSGNIDPTQLAEVLHRLRSVGVIKSWTVSSDGDSIKSSPSIEANMLAARTVSPMGDNCRLYGQKIGSADVGHNPVGSGWRARKRKAGTITQVVENGGNRLGRTAISPLAQITDRISPHPSETDPRQNSPPTDSCRKRRRKTHSAPLQGQVDELDGAEEPEESGLYPDDGASTMSPADAVTVFPKACGLAKSPCLRKQELSQVFSLST
ncbi:hypothetical protein BDV59DRAFT_119843 [Aspergillus ambiguus]|uniref:uncharacterized protein n=1 Tax=Aspergillus ambiguus TaxID=176160 RepID=UPI003CCE1903